jgi:hypothetical protein
VRLLAHLRGEGEDVGLEELQVGVLAQVVDALAHLVELGRQREHALAVGDMGGVVGLGHVAHLDLEAAVAVLELEDPHRGGEEGGDQDEEDGQADLEGHARALRGAARPGRFDGAREDPEGGGDGDGHHGQGSEPEDVERNHVQDAHELEHGGAELHRRLPLCETMDPRAAEAARCQRNGRRGRTVPLTEVGPLEVWTKG